MQVLKDQRYKAIKSLIESKGITGLKEVFTIMPLSVVRQDMKINYNTLRRRVNEGEALTVKDILALAGLFEVDHMEVFRLIIHDLNTKSRGKRR
jgi:hypothetical protein